MFSEGKVLVFFFNRELNNQVRIIQIFPNPSTSRARTKDRGERIGKALGPSTRPASSRLDCRRQDNPAPSAKLKVTFTRKDPHAVPSRCEITIRRISEKNRRDPRPRCGFRGGSRGKTHAHRTMMIEDPLGVHKEIQRERPGPRRKNSKYELC